MYAKQKSSDPFKSIRSARCIAVCRRLCRWLRGQQHPAEQVSIKLNAFCLPNDPDLSMRLVRAVTIHVERVPPNTTMSTATLVAGALAKAFPCTKRLNPRSDSGIIRPPFAPMAESCTQRIQNPPPKGVPVRVWLGAPVKNNTAFLTGKPFLFVRNPDGPQPMSLTVDDFDFPLPPNLIAQHPAAERTGSRLLHVCGVQHVHRRFADLPSLLKAGDLLVFNDTRVIKARFFGLKESGRQGRDHARTHRRCDDAICQIRASKAPKQGCKLLLADAFTVTMTGRLGPDGDFFVLELAEAAAISGNWPNSTASCRCRPTSNTRPKGLTKPVTRRSMPASRAPSRRRPPAWISTKQCWPA